VPSGSLRLWSLCSVCSWWRIASRPLLALQILRLRFLAARFAQIYLPYGVTVHLGDVDCSLSLETPLANHKKYVRAEG
jgi:hypothetical protein